MPAVNDEPVVAAHVLRLNARSEGILDVLRRAGHTRPLVSLSQALVASPPARTLTGVTLAVRESPQPLLVFVGEVDAAGRARLLALEGLLEEASVRLRIVTWADVEAACQQLAAHIIDRLGPAEAERCLLVPIPRGGHVVAGLLAYALELPRERVVSLAEAAATDDDRVRILVDDCILSGVRLREVMSNVSAQRLLVATLYSHAALRDAVESQEPRIVACLAAEDLHDHAADLLGTDAAAWRERWTARVSERYHTALLDLIVFPWSEPEVRLWNTHTEQIEPHWWLAPPSGCFQHRVSAPHLDVQSTDDRPDATQLAPQVVALDIADATLLIDTSASGRSTRMTGTSHELWHAWIEAASIDRAARTVASRYGIAEARVAADLRDLLTDLQRRALVVNGWQ